MKKQILIILCVLTMSVGYSQEVAKKTMSYQSIVLDTTGMVLVGDTVGVQLTILEGSPTGTSVYVERHTAVTSSTGLLSLEIGGGTEIMGNYDSIDWSMGPFSIKSEIDPKGGTAYSISGTSPLMSVPYALYAHTGKEIDPVFDTSIAAGITEMDRMRWNSKQNKLIAGNNVSIIEDTIHFELSGSGGSDTEHYIGKFYGGGIIVWLDRTKEHGLIMSLVDLSTSQVWSDKNGWVLSYDPIDGVANTALILAQQGQTSSAARLCDQYVNNDYGTGVFDDWYLPAIEELSYVKNNFYAIQKALDTDEDPATIPLGINYEYSDEYYWSSTHSDNYTRAFAFTFKIGRRGTISKDEGKLVRAFRAF